MGRSLSSGKDWDILEGGISSGKQDSLKPVPSRMLNA